MLLKTLPAMLRADYPHDVWVLDEGDDDDVKLLCQELGVKYFSRRPINRYNQFEGRYAGRTKGGNHNAWYDAHGRHYDIVAQIDTDFVPRRDFLTRTLGHFRDPRVAFVGTPQVYGNEDQSVVARGAAQQLYQFYGAIMRGLGGRHMCTMIGANHIVRVAALKDIGFYVGHLTEDLITGMRLHASGWTSAYVPVQLAVGEGPATWQAYFNQQMRWAFGCMDILRRHTRALTRTMGRRSRIRYIALQQHYFAGVAMAAGIALLAAYFFGGLSPARVAPLQVVFWFTPLLVARTIVGLWLQRFNTASNERGWLWTGRLISIATWPIYLLAAIGVMRGRRLSFKVTPKGDLQDVDHTPMMITAPHLLIGGINLIFLGCGLLLARTSVPLMGWATANVVLMLGFVVYVARGNRRAYLRSRRPAQRVEGRSSLAVNSAEVALER